MNKVSNFLLRKWYPLPFFIFIVFVTETHAQFYNGYQMQFGKNRVQFNERFWSFYRFKEFDTYFYKGGSELAVYTGRVVSSELAPLEKLLDYRLDGRLQFIIYNKLSESKQSNIGLETEEISNNIGGLTRIVGNKVFIYFNGDHRQLREQIRAGIARVLIDQIMYGGDFKDRIQNSAFLYFPEWYVNGIVSYLSREWNPELDNKMRDGVISGRYKNINHLRGDDAVIVGHSLWKYIVDTYGENAVPNLLYMTRINRNVESGFIYVIGLSLKALSDNWKVAVSNMYRGSDENRILPEQQSVIRKPKAKLLYNEASVSPDGRHLVYVTNDLGRYKVILQDIEKKKKKKIKRGGFRSYVQQTDESYPMLAWHPTGKLIAMIRERKGKIWLGFYNLDNKKYEESELFNFDKVLDFSYSDNGQDLLMSAIQKGQSDIFIYNLRSRTFEQITKDIYEDLTPRFINGSKGILFCSNRVNDSLDIDPKKFVPGSATTDIFYYDFNAKSRVLKRLTNTPEFNEKQPVPFESSSFAYLSDENGIVNRYTATMDSALSYVDTTEHYRMVVNTTPQTNYSRNILSHNVNQKRDKIVETIYRNGKIYMYIESITSPATGMNLQNTLFRNESLTQVKEDTGLAGQTGGQDSSAATPGILDVPVTETESKTDSNAVDIDNYVFQDIFPKSKQKKSDRKKEEQAISFNLEKALTAIPDSEFVVPSQRNYETAFSSDYFVLQIDNSLLNTSYQAFTGGGAYYDPGINGFIKMGINDLLEDYRFTGGFKLSGDLNSNEYFISYEDIRKRLDKQIIFFRQARFLSSGFYSAKVHTHELRYLNKWPFSDVASVRGSVSYRNDRLVFYSVEPVMTQRSLSEPNQYLNWATARLEFVFDNTLNTGLNLYNGTRLKLFGEYFKQVDSNPSGMYVLGLDVRHYQKIHRELIWANRLAASTSFGKEKLIYYMGGTDNWIAPDFNDETPIDYTQPYAYQALATNMRGFSQNIRNGNNFVLVNSEIRFPVFTYLLNRPIKSDFIRNFQVVGFGDIGTAWNGSSPYDSTSALNNQIITRGPFTVTIISQHEPIVGGYGFGLRSRIIGYFLRADWAWGVEDGVTQPRIFMLSLGLDF